MILLMQPENAGKPSAISARSKMALKWFGLWYGAYPYETITMVDPPFGADGRGRHGVPHPHHGRHPWWPGSRRHRSRRVVVHEFGHQYWYGMVGTNEFEESWLDEGFNTYSTGKVIDRAYGPHDLRFHLLRIPLAQLPRTAPYRRTTRQSQRLSALSANSTRWCAMAGNTTAPSATASIPTCGRPCCCAPWRTTWARR